MREIAFIGKLENDNYLVCNKGHFEVWSKESVENSVSDGNFCFLNVVSKCIEDRYLSGKVPLLLGDGSLNGILIGKYQSKERLCVLGKGTFPALKVNGLSLGSGEYITVRSRKYHLYDEEKYTDVFRSILSIPEYGLLVSCDDEENGCRIRKFIELCSEKNNSEIKKLWVGGFRRTDLAEELCIIGDLISSVQVLQNGKVMGCPFDIFTGLRNLVLGIDKDGRKVSRKLYGNSCIKKQVELYNSFWSDKMLKVVKGVIKAENIGGGGYILYGDFDHTYEIQVGIGGVVSAKSICMGKDEYISRLYQIDTSKCKNTVCVDRILEKRSHPRLLYSEKYSERI